MAGVEDPSAQELLRQYTAFLETEKDGKSSIVTDMMEEHSTRAVLNLNDLRRLDGGGEDLTKQYVWLGLGWLGTWLCVDVLRCMYVYLISSLLFSLLRLMTDPTKHIPIIEKALLTVSVELCVS